MGVVFWIIYDAFKAIRLFFRISVTGVFISDIIFFIIAAPIEFCFLLSRCNGEIRGFVLAVQAVGFIICKCTFSKIYVKLLKLLFSMLSKLFRFINLFCCKTFDFADKNFKKIYANLKYFLKKSIFSRKKGWKLIYQWCIITLAYLI